MSHYDEARAGEAEKQKAQRQTARQRINEQAGPPLAELARVIIGARYVLGVEAQHHLQQKLRELRLLITDYTA